MGLLGLLNHLLNFLAPALAVGLLTAALAPLLIKKAHSHHSWLRQGAMNCVACGVALALGLVFFGRDAKMATYAAMVLACASCQWVGAKAWRT